MPRCTPTSALSEFVRMRDYARYFKASWRVTEGRPILVLQEASWKGGELRMCLREPFENLILSNRASRTNGTDSNEGGSNFDRAILITGWEAGIRIHSFLQVIELMDCSR